MATVTADAKKEAQRAAAQGPSYTERAASAAHETVDKLATRAAGAEESIRSGVSQSAEQLSARRQQLQTDMEANLERARSFASQNPLTTAGIAFAAGMLLSALFRRGH